MIDIQMNGLNSVHQCAVPAISKPNHTHTYELAHTPFDGIIYCRKSKVSHAK